MSTGPRKWLLFIVTCMQVRKREDAAAEQQPAEGPAATGAAAGTAQQGSKPSTEASPIYGEM